MYVCLCKSVSDRTIRQTVEEGARNWCEVRELTGCGTQCGKCACMGKTITDDAVARQIVPSADFAYAV